MEEISNNPVVSGLSEGCDRAITIGVGRQFPGAAFWITVYGLLMLAFAWQAGFQFNVAPRTLNRLLAGALSVVGLVFCIKMIWMNSRIDATTMRD